jgi:glycosyltransferase involved in cell wall biosynthesis
MEGSVAVDSAKAEGRPLRVAAFTGGVAVPSARFRVRQYIAPLAAVGIALSEHWPGLGAYPPRRRVLRPGWLIGTLAQRLPQLATARDADVVLLQREMVSTLTTLEGLTRHPRLVDIDDAIHLYRGGRTAQRLAALAQLVVVGNAWLAEIWRHWNPEVEILPTPVDADRFRPAALPDEPTIGWIGSSDNLPYITAIAPALAEAVRRVPKTTIAVCCDRRPQLPDLPVRYVPWSENAEADFLGSITVGIMPLSDGPWERGKCSFKMLQYMATGRPCVASPVGMNRQLLAEAEFGLAATTISEWTEALCSLLSDRDAALRMGITGRELAVANYSVSALAPRFAALIRRLA